MYIVYIENNAALNVCTTITSKTVQFVNIFNGIFKNCVLLLLKTICAIFLKLVIIFKMGGDLNSDLIKFH